MDIILFLKGIFVGFLIAAPVGPVGILCIHRTLETGLKSGLASGIGAAAADTVFGVLPRSASPSSPTRCWPTKPPCA